MTLNIARTSKRVSKQVYAYAYKHPEKTKVGYTIAAETIKAAGFVGLFHNASLGEMAINLPLFRLAVDNMEIFLNTLVYKGVTHHKRFMKLANKLDKNIESLTDEVEIKIATEKRNKILNRKYDQNVVNMQVNNINHLNTLRPVYDFFISKIKKH